MPKRVLQARKLITLAALCAVLTTALVVPAQLHAQEPPVPTLHLHVESQGSDTVISLGLPAGKLSGGALAAAAERELPIEHFGGYELPMQYVTLALTAGSTPSIEVRQLEGSTLAELPKPAAPELPPALDWEPDANVAPAAPRLPDAPVFVVRSGAIRGQHYAVIAISPIYQENGVAKVAGSLRVVVPGAKVVRGDLLKFVANARQATVAETVAVPVNAAALRSSYKITVAQPGLQEVSYSQLGLAAEPTNLRLAVNGTEVALEKAGDRLRFYAPSVGDRWNATSAYWLTLEAGQTISERGEVDAGPARGAYEEGKWEDNRLYEAGYRGADGDHWFHKKLEAPTVYGPDADVTQSEPVTVAVQTMLPLRSGVSTFRIVATDIAGYSTECDKPYHYYVQGANGDHVLETQVVSWTPAPACNKQPTGTAIVSTSQPISGLMLRLDANGLSNSSVLLESVTWKRPVDLNFQGMTTSAEFVTDAGAGSFALTNLPAIWRLYDVTEANEPRFIAAGNGGSYTLNQAASARAGRYLLANLGALVTPYAVYLPSVTSTYSGSKADVYMVRQQRLDAHSTGAVLRPPVKNHTAVQFDDVRAANAIYIGPAAFADELAPLLALRQSQGFQPLFVDVQTIYDVYGYGQVSAVAIRNFLRQETDWQNTARQISVVLAGDATFDPFAYAGVANDTLVAAWMDEVDPYAAGVAVPFGEAACDACIAQLNGDNPLTGDSLAGGREWFAADVWIGRFPVRSEQEIADLVAKLVTYDTVTKDTDNWRMRKVFLADNYIKALDSQKNAQYDYAGDFAALSDTVVGVLPDGMGIERIYYDPAPDRQIAYAEDGQTSIPAGNGYYQTVARAAPQSWRIDDVGAASFATIQALSSGAGLVVYNGHSNHFYYAKTEDLRNTPAKDSWLLSTSEVSLLANQNKPFVMLSMTCYTSQFVKPAANGTIDEWLIRAKNAGAIAVWGPTGLSVVSGHELLQAGFLKQLQTEPVGSQRLGNLVAAGYAKVLEGGSLDPLMTYVLLGDPLTRARIPTRELYMPVVSR